MEAEAVKLENIRSVQIVGWRTSSDNLYFEGNLKSDFPQTIQVEDTIFHLEDVDDEFTEDDGEGNTYELATYFQSL